MPSSLLKLYIWYLPSGHPPSSHEGLAYLILKDNLDLCKNKNNLEIMSTEYFFMKVSYKL